MLHHVVISSQLVRVSAFAVTMLFATVAMAQSPSVPPGGPPANAGQDTGNWGTVPFTGQSILRLRAEDEVRVRQLEDRQLLERRVLDRRHEDELRDLVRRHADERESLRAEIVRQTPPAR